MEKEHVKGHARAHPDRLQDMLNTYLTLSIHQLLVLLQTSGYGLSDKE